MFKSALLADGVKASGIVWHQVVRADDQVRAEAIPAKVDLAPLGTAGASAAIRSGGTLDVTQVRDWRGFDGKHALDHRCPHIVVRHIGWTEEYGHAQSARLLQDLVDAWHKRSNALGGGFAPVKIPDIDDDHADLPRVHFLRSKGDGASLGIALAQLDGQTDSTRSGEQSGYCNQKRGVRDGVTEGFRLHSDYSRF